MSTTGDSPAERVNDVDRCLAECQRAVREALRQHRLAGNPIAVSRNGRVEWIPPEEIPVEPIEDDPK